MRCVSYTASARKNNSLDLNVVHVVPGFQRQRGCLDQKDKKAHTHPAIQDSVAARLHD